MLKIISWNCNGGFRNKYPSLAPLGADILVIQECEDPSSSTEEYRNWAGRYLWTGHIKHKGLGVFVRNDHALIRHDWDDQGLQSFLPCRIDDQLDLVAVWTKQANSPNFGYIGQLWKYLQLHGGKLKGDSILLVGDLNSNTRWDEWDRWWNHSDVVRELAVKGMRSLYHEQSGEIQGAESCPTLFLQRNVNKPYHVDYAFASTRLFNTDTCELVVGVREDWIKLSDHMPLVFTLDY